MQEKKQSDTTQQPVPPDHGVALGGGSEGRSGSHRAGLVQKQPYCGGKGRLHMNETGERAQSED